MIVDCSLELRDAEWLGKVKDPTDPECLYLVGMSAHQDRPDSQLRRPVCDITPAAVRQSDISDDEAMRTRPQSFQGLSFGPCAIRLISRVPEDVAKQAVNIGVIFDQQDSAPHGP
jgi:hypothetical protein